MKPFLKWAGNKQRLLERIKSALPPGGKRLIEPFVGSGAVFLNTDYSGYILSDANKDLINLYKILQNEGREFVNFCKLYFTDDMNNELTYYRLREQFNTSDDVNLKSALFLYMNRHGYNGLCRYNASGKFNVPFGKYKAPYFPEKEMMSFHEKSRNATFINEDFMNTMRMAKKGDVVYCDPPYVPLTPSANFTAFSPGGFTMDKQVLLADFASVLASNGIPVLISNHDTPFTKDKYSRADIHTFDVRRFISCKGENRGKAGELLALFT